MDESLDLSSGMSRASLDPESGDVEQIAAVCLKRKSVTNCRGIINKKTL